MRDKVNDGARIALMLESIANIESFLAEDMTFDSFVSNKLLCHAVIYNLQCIGESTYMLSKDFKTSHTETNWDIIAGLRHVLVHDYYQVNMETVWAVVQKDLPQLKQYLTFLLHGQDAD
ncbi:MAG: DUF86 domain-containing protein [Bacteroidales bacterium]|nr:DUF86 domain-containing protein [Bacteroidales bacterium]